MYIDFRDEEGERNTDGRNIDWLPPVLALTRDQTHNLLVYGRTFQTTEPPAGGGAYLLILLCGNGLKTILESKY